MTPREPDKANPDATDEKAKDSKVHMIMDNKLKVAGLGQIMADTCLLAYGAATGNMKVGSVGLLGYTAGIVGTRYGNPKDEKQLEIVERHLGEYLKKQGVEIPKDPTLDKLTKEGGFIEHAEAFLYSAPSQLMNACYGLMGVQFARSGIEHKQKALATGGALLIAGALAGLLINAKEPDPNNPPKGAFQKAWSWIQENPLRLSGTLFNLNQVALTLDALEERKRNPGSKAYMYKLAAVAGFLLCNTMLAMSTQGHGGGEKMDEETRTLLAEHAARVIAAQPPEVQNSLIDQISGFLATQPYIDMKAQDIAKLMREKVESTKQLPAAGWQSRMGQFDAAGQPTR